MKEHPNMIEARLSAIAFRARQDAALAASQDFQRGARVKCVAHGMVHVGTVVDESPGSVGVHVDGSTETQWFSKRAWEIAEI